MGFICKSDFMLKKIKLGNLEFNSVWLWLMAVLPSVKIF